MPNQIPNSVIGAVSAVLADYYFNHSTLNSMFMESGAPGDVPEGNCETKCNRWLKICNEDPDIDALDVLGRVIQQFMDKEPSEDDSKIKKGQKRIKNSLARNQLTYQLNGHIILSGSSPVAKSLSNYFKAGDFASIEIEFERAISQIDSDPHAAITASSSIIEALCKTYIETNSMEMPSKQNIVPLWRVVQLDLGLNPNPTLADDQNKILQGLSSIVDGIEAYRTHIGSAHGRGIEPPPIAAHEARLSVNAAHTLIVFVMERWTKMKSNS